jgi:RNA methyltransferase, TrmH family
MITSSANHKIKLIRALLSQRRVRESERAFVIEGVRLAEEAARAGSIPHLVLHTATLDERGQAALEALKRSGAHEVSAVTPNVMRSVSDTPTPQGLLAVIPLSPSFPILPPALSLALVLDGISDPGNLGTILRTALASAVEAVFLTPGTADAYNPKVVRAALGAHFRLPIIETNWADLRQRLAHTERWRAEAREGKAYDHVDWRQPSALVIGSEAEGPSEAARQFAEHQVHIPMPGPTESLNAAVAAGVLLFEIARQRH